MTVGVVPSSTLQMKVGRENISRIMQQLAVTVTSTGSKVRVPEQKQQPATATPGQAAFATEENCHLGTNEGQ